VLGALALRFSGSAPNLVSGLSGSAPNVGIAIGSWTAGIALTSPLQQAGPPLVGTVAAVLTLVPLTALALMRATRSETPPPRAAADRSLGGGLQDDSRPRPARAASAARSDGSSDGGCQPG
jgi:DHA1 family inner membrane transport protein